MSNLASFYDLVGVARNAPITALYRAYNHWRTLLRPLLEEEASLEHNGRERLARRRSLVRIDDAYDALLKARHQHHNQNQKQNTRQRKRAR